MKRSNNTRLLATDQQQSTLRYGDTVRAFTPFGFGLHSGAAFNGEWLDQVTGWYLLGNGYRAFSTLLMRFICPDSWSPFGEGGLNAYAYCHGDPVNGRDPTGHMVSLRRLLRRSSGASNTLEVPLPTQHIGNIYSAPPTGLPRASGAPIGIDNSGHSSVSTLASSVPTPPPKRTDVMKVKRTTTTEVTTRDGSIYRTQETVIKSVGSRATYIDSQGVERVDGAAPVIIDLRGYSDLVFPPNRVVQAPPLPPRVRRINTGNVRQ